MSDWLFAVLLAAIIAAIVIGLARWISR